MAEPEKGDGLLEQIKQQLARGQITEAEVLKLLGGTPEAVVPQVGQVVGEQTNIAVQGDGNVIGEHGRSRVDKGSAAASGGRDRGAASGPVFDQHEQEAQVQLNVAHLYQIYQNAPGRAELSEEGFKKILEDYLDWVRREYGTTRLHGLQNLLNTGALDKPLSQVYTSLAVHSRPAVEPGEGKERFHPSRDAVGAAEAAPLEPLDMANLLTLGARVAIVGAAGSGKTTYLSFVAASLAAALRGERLDLRLKSPVPDGPLPVPLLAPLRFWSVYREQCAKVPGLRLQEPDAGSLGAFLLWFLRARYQNFDAAGDFFKRLLRGGQGCLIMLDGLDEVVSVAERRVVRDGVGKLLTSQYPGNRCLVTAREAGYKDAPFGSDFVRCDVLPMNEEQITTLVQTWCRQIYLQPGTCDAACGELEAAIHMLNAERVRRGQEPLIATPLMVTMVVSVKYSHRKLPRERAKLYDACVDVILNGEYTGCDDDAGAGQGVISAGGDPAKQREWLSLLAFRMHQAGEGGATLDEDGVRRLLQPVFEQRGEQPLLDPFVDVLRHRGGLFGERGDRFQFAHLTFQEYLAAQFLSRQWQQQPAGFLAKIVSDEWWREVLLLTIGSLGAPTPFERRQDFVKALCGLQAPLPVQVAAAELAATGLSDLVDPEPVLVGMARDRLVALLQDKALPAVKPQGRAAAGRALALVGDPRPGVGTRRVALKEGEIEIPDLAWCAVPAGSFLMGAEDITADEKPRHSVSLPAFKISRYPVTQAQYALFVEAGGYQERRYWVPDGWKYKERENCKGPRDRGVPFNLPNHPVVNVSWYEALAFCTWLTEVLQGAGLLDRKELVTLPSEAEWEKAARGTDGWMYPWGNRWEDNRANTSEAGIGSTTAVGLFPEGASPYGCLDMAGNVWAWTRSLWGKDLMQATFKYPYDPADGRENLEAGADSRRVLRGGSFSGVQRLARCAFRYRNYPYYFLGYSGFRVVSLSASGL